MTKISETEIARIAELARLSYSSEELAQFRSSFEEILEYFEKLREVTTEGVLPSYHALWDRTETPLMGDRREVSLAREAVLDQAPESKDGHFRVPKVID